MGPTGISLHLHISNILALLFECERRIRMFLVIFGRFGHYGIIIGWVFRVCCILAWPSFILKRNVETAFHSEISGRVRRKTDIIVVGAMLDGREEYLIALQRHHWLRFYD